MKRRLFLLGMAICLFSCEEVIEIDVPTEEPRLVIDAVIRIDTTVSQFFPEIKVGLTSGFFDTNPVTGLTDVTIINLSLPTTGGENGIVLEETEPNSGIYREVEPVATEFFTSGDLILQLTHEGKSYFARTSYVPTVQIDNIRIGSETLFNEDETEVIIELTDLGNREDFYVFDFGFGEFLAVEDAFFNGQQFEFSYFYQKEIESGQELSISILGADQDYFNYMDLLIEQTFNDGGIFETPVATVRGNIFDVTDLDNEEVVDNVQQPEKFPLGYFAVVQEFKETIVTE